MWRPTEKIRFFGLGLRLVERRDGPDTLEVVDFEYLRHAMGEKLPGGFLRLFVWAARWIVGLSGRPALLDRLADA
jgi:hypothetical protein